MSTDDKMREIEVALEQFETDVMSLHTHPKRKQLLALIRAAIAPQAEAEQRLSFAFGNASIDNPSVTREMVAEAEQAAKVSEWNTVEHGKRADAEHEAKVSAWFEGATMDRCESPRGAPDGPRALGYFLTADEINEALRLMRARPTTEAGPSAVDALRHLQQIIYKRTPEQLDDEIGAMIEAAAKPGPSALERLLDKIRSEADNADESYSAGLHRAADIIDEEMNNGR